MPLIPEPVQRIAHQVGAVPLLVVLCIAVASLTVVRRAKLPAGSWWIAAGLFMSYVGDSMFFDWGWRASFVWVPAQIALVLGAFLETGRDRLIVANLCATAAVLSYLVTPADRPELLLYVAGSIAILWMSRTHPYRWPLRVYFSVGTVGYMWTYSMLPGPELSPAYYVMQAARVVANLHMAGIALRLSFPRRRAACGNGSSG